MLNSRRESPRLKMQCTLLIPHLFWPRESAESALTDLALPVLTKLVARARAERFPFVTAEAWLCQAFEVERQHDWPIAPLTLELDGGEAGVRYWLRADPVHIKVGREGLLLVENALFDVTQNEADALVAALNQHFAGDALQLQFRTWAPKRWYVTVSRAPELATRELSEAAGQDVQGHLPTGSDAGHWRRLFNEAQMLLHAHPVNDAREERGEPPVNSVWFWGGGTRPAVPGRHFSAVWSDEAVALALGAAADAQAAELPGDAAAWLERTRREDARAAHLLVIDALTSAVAHHDVEAWRNRIAMLERQWFGPLAAALRAGRVSHLALVAPGGAGCWRFEAGRRDWLKFWRGGEPLSRYA